MQRALKLVSQGAVVTCVNNGLAVRRMSELFKDWMHCIRMNNDR